MNGFSFTPTACLVLLLWIGLWSIAAAVLTVSDKSRARRHAWRIPEAALFTAAALGGSAAMLLVMLLIRHKTKHPKFMLGLPLILCLQIPPVLWILRRF